MAPCPRRGRLTSAQAFSYWSGFTTTDNGTDSEMTPDLEPPTSTAARAMSQAATTWLAGLSDSQRAVAWWGPPGGDHEEERRRWFYTPTDHGGLALNAQVAEQQRRAMQLVAAGTSDAGYDLVSTVMGNENVLDRVEHFSSNFDTLRGRDPSRYYLRVFGDPEGDGPWTWRFGGHHVSLNFLVVDGEVRSSTPRFFGLDPARSADPGTGYTQRDYELLTVTSAPKGIAGSDLDSSQKEILDLLVRTYHDALPPGLAPHWDVDELHFAWAGPTDVGAPNYYRIQSDDLLIEWDSVARDANHAHGVVRHVSNDFGEDVLGAHRAAWHTRTPPGEEARQ